MNGTPSKHYDFPTKKFVQMLDLKDDAELIKAYRKQHAAENMWPEIMAGIKEVGILEMEIFIQGNHLVMIVETPADFDWNTAMSRLATMPRQQEWETWNSQFQACNPNDTSDEKWKMMELMFHLYE